MCRIVYIGKKKSKSQKQSTKEDTKEMDQDEDDSSQSSESVYTDIHQKRGRSKDEDAPKGPPKKKRRITTKHTKQQTHPAKKVKL